MEKRSILMKGVVLTALTVALWGCKKEIPGLKNPSASAGNLSVCPSDMTIHFDGPALPDVNTVYWWVYEATADGDTVLLKILQKNSGDTYTGDVVDDLEPGCFELPMLVGHTYLLFGSTSTSVSVTPCHIPTSSDEYISVKFTGVSHGKLVARYNTCNGTFSVTETGANMDVSVNPYGGWSTFYAGDKLD